jgi:DnaJ-class molecular chaperone
VTQKDYYGVLGVDRKVGPKEIKQAYRTLALRYHPDRNQNSPDAAARMKEINEAYAVLSDPDKRRRYDGLWDEYGPSAHGQFRQAYSEQDIFRGSDVHQIFEEISRTFGFRGFNEVFRDAYGPGYQKFEFRRPGVFGRVYVSSTGRPGARQPLGASQGPFGKLFRYALKRQWGIEIPERGRDLNDLIVISPVVALNGGKVLYSSRLHDKELMVRIPSRIRGGQRIRLKGMGGPGKGGGDPGDLYLKVRVRGPWLQGFKDVVFRLRSRLSAR